MAFVATRRACIFLYIFMPDSVDDGSFPNLVLRQLVNIGLAFCTHEFTKRGNIHNWANHKDRTGTVCMLQALAGYLKRLSERCRWAHRFP